MASIGFIGLGNMGGPMASNLLKAGHKVRAFDIVQESLDKIVAEGAEACTSAGEATVGVEILVSMLPASLHVESLYLGDEGILEKISVETLVID